MNRRKTLNPSYISIVKPKSKPFKLNDYDGDDGSEVCISQTGNSFQGPLNNKGSYRKENEISINSRRPSDLYIPSAHEIERISSCILEPCAPLYESIPKLNLGGSLTTWTGSQKVFYDESMYDGTISKVKPPSPLIEYGELPNMNCVEPELKFYSNFECGNLLQANRVGHREYDLVLRADAHTIGYSQWFYFAVTLPPHGSISSSDMSVRFNIVNLTKPESLYNDGMKPLIYDCNNKEKGWRRTGSGIRYSKNTYLRLDSKGKPVGSNDTYMTLSFTVDFPVTTGRTFLLAHSYPYTYTDHERHMQSILSDDRKSSIIKRSTLCYTLGGRQCDLLTITDFNVSAIEMSEKCGIVLTGRVHPGETTSSWIMRGIINYLIGDTHTAVNLRKKYVFKIVPMLNPDGVALGNNRCSLSGVDLNRQWDKPDFKLHPTIDSTKKMIQSLQIQRQVALFIDIHNHSRKRWGFFYGVGDPGYGNKKLKSRNCNLVKDFIRKICTSPGGKHFFSYNECNFVTTKDREGTARVVAARELNIVLSFTLEVSFAGTTAGVFSSSHFNIKGLLDMSRFIFDGLNENGKYESLNTGDYIIQRGPSPIISIPSQVISTSSKPTTILPLSVPLSRKKTYDINEDLPSIRRLQTAVGSVRSSSLKTFPFSLKEEESSLIEATLRWKPPSSINTYKQHDIKNEESHSMEATLGWKPLSVNTYKHNDIKNDIGCESMEETLRRKQPSINTYNDKQNDIECESMEATLRRKPPSTNNHKQNDVKNEECESIDLNCEEFDNNEEENNNFNIIEGDSKIKNDKYYWSEKKLIRSKKHKKKVGKHWKYMLKERRRVFTSEVECTQSSCTILPFGEKRSLLRPRTSAIGQQYINPYKTTKKYLDTESSNIQPIIWSNSTMMTSSQVYLPSINTNNQTNNK